ncbi:hypothetical protein HID58_092798 [Brassica napus]|uniref:Uncharacterized protein n=1 Tax=Brassica napus TaxID=3708 RepID=A0ABQ7XFN0_BRANA|nr:hypothetical protein HID58_092798 [Brassica napus]
MSQGISGNARPTIFNCETVCDQRGEVVREIDSADPAEADAHWVALSNVEEPPPEPWVPVRPFSERVIGRPSRCTLPFLGTVLKGFPQGDRGWKSYFTLDWIKPRLPWSAFPRLGDCGGVGVHNPIPPFLEDLCVVRNLLRGGPLLWGYFSPERVRAAVETHRSCFSSSIDDDMGVFFEDTSLPAVYATGQSSGQRPPDAEDDAEPTVEDPVFGG